MRKAKSAKGKIDDKKGRTRGRRRRRYADSEGGEEEAWGKMDLG